MKGRITCKSYKEFRGTNIKFMRRNYTDNHTFGITNYSNEYEDNGHKTQFTIMLHEYDFPCA